MGLASRIGIFGIGAALLFSISCEKHQVGEYPEVQREQMTTADNPNRAPSAGTSATPTPVNFFPAKKSP
jgi:hypothetical protein